MKYSKPSNIVWVMFLENATMVETRGQWEKERSFPGLRENIEEGGWQPEMNTSPMKQEKEQLEIADPHQDLLCDVCVVYWCVM